MLLNILFIILGLGLLVVGAEGLVRGASSLAVKLRIPALVIGLTIVSFGTSAPELTVNIVAAMNGAADIAVGNVVGSNIANILLILGICAVIAPLTVKSSTVWKEIPLAILGMILLIVMGNDAFFDGVSFNSLTRTDGITFLALMVIFMYYIFGMARSEKTEIKEESNEDLKQYPTYVSAIFIVFGLAALIAGGKLLVDAAVDIAKAAGMSEALIGLTIVGVGTSLPELATSVVATLRKQYDIAIGNVVGSNIFNVFLILGISSTVLPLPISSSLSIDILVGIGVTALLFAYMFISGKHRLNRWQGGSFIALYSIYVVYLIQRG